MPYEERRATNSSKPSRRWKPAALTSISPCANGKSARPFAKRAQSLLGEVRAKLDAAQARPNRPAAAAVRTRTTCPERY